MRGLRVLHVDSGREWRGGQNQVRLLAGELAGRPGVAQALATARGSRLAAEGEALELELRPLAWRAALDPRALLGLARAAAGRDVVHAHDSHGLQAAWLAICLRGVRAALVGSRRVLRPVRSPWLYRRCDLVLAVSGAVREVLVRQGIERRRVEVVPDGIDPGELEPQAPERLRGLFAAAAGEVELVGTVGALTPEKGHDVLLRAVREVAARRPAARFVLVGEGPERGRLERLAAELGVADRVVFAGRLEAAARALSGLDVFVLPSLEEGLSTAYLEALAAGVPAIATLAGGQGEVAGEALPTVPPGDPSALAAGILELLGSPARRREVAAAGRRRSEGFSAARMAGATLAAYERVAGP